MRWETPLDQRQVGRGIWMLLADLVCVSAIAAARRSQRHPDGRIVVPVRFIYDGASVPRVPVAYWMMGGRAWAPAAVHDYGYQHPDEDDRALWDAIFYELMGVDQPELGHEAEATWVRAAMYAGVRIGGWVAWARHEKRAAELNPVWSATAWPDAAPPESP